MLHQYLSEEGKERKGREGRKGKRERRDGWPVPAGHAAERMGINCSWGPNETKCSRRVWSYTQEVLFDSAQHKLLEEPDGAGQGQEGRRRFAVRKWVPWARVRGREAADTGLSGVVWGRPSPCLPPPPPREQLEQKGSGTRGGEGEGEEGEAALLS